MRHGSCETQAIKKNPYYCWLKPVFIKGEGENLQCCVLKNSLACTAKAYYFTPSLLDVLPLNMMPHPARSINNLVPPMHTCSTPFTLLLKLYDPQCYLHSNCSHSSDRFLIMHLQRSKLSVSGEKRHICTSMTEIWNNQWQQRHTMCH